MVKKTEKASEETEYAKRAQSAFFFFAGEHRERLLTETADADGKKDVAKVGKLIGEMWAKLSDKEKEPFQKKADKDKIRYEKQIASGMSTKPRKEKKPEKKKKDPNAPKRPMSGYMRWLSENRQDIIKDHKIDASKVADVTKKGGELWKAMSDAKKKKYNDVADKEMAAWKEETEKYKAANAAEAA